MRRFAPLLIAAAFLLLPSVAAACAVCGFGEDESRGAYISTTVFLSALPPLLVGGFVLLIRRLMKAEARRSDPARPL